MMELSTLDNDGVRHEIESKPTKNYLGNTVCGRQFVWRSSGGVIWASMEGRHPTVVMTGSQNRVTCLVCLATE